MDKIKEIALYIKQSKDELAGGIFEGDKVQLTMLEDLQSDLTALQEQTRWRNKNNEPPKEDEKDAVLFVDETLVESGEFKNGMFWDNNGYGFDKAIYWMPIPKLPKE